MRALLELNSRTNGFGLIAIAQLGKLRGLSLPNPSPGSQYQWLRFVSSNNTDLQTLVNIITGGDPSLGDHLRNWEQLNDLLRYYYIMAKQAIDNNGLATSAGMEGLEGVARATFLLGMAVRFLSGAGGVPSGTILNIFWTAQDQFGNVVVVDFRVKTWIRDRDGKPIDTRIFGYMEPFLGNSEVDSILQKLLKASEVLANAPAENNPGGLKVLVLIIDSAEPGALDGLCGAIRGRSWATPVMVISGGRVACTGGSITQTQQQAVCSVLGLCSSSSFMVCPLNASAICIDVLNTIQSIGKGVFVIPSPTTCQQGDESNNLCYR